MIVPCRLQGSRSRKDMVARRRLFRTRGRVAHIAELVGHASFGILSFAEHMRRMIRGVGSAIRIAKCHEPMGTAPWHVSKGLGRAVLML